MPRLGFILWFILIYVLTTKPETMLIHLYCVGGFFFVVVVVCIIAWNSGGDNELERKIAESDRKRKREWEAYKQTEEYKRAKEARERMRQERAVRH
jgi:hypothetical protein